MLSVKNFRLLSQCLCGLRAFRASFIQINLHCPYLFYALFSIEATTAPNKPHKTHNMTKLPTVKSILNTPSIFEGFTFEDMVTVGRVNAEQATSTCMINAQKDYMENHGWADMKNVEGFLNKWSKLESQVRRKFEEAQEIASIL